MRQAGQQQRFTLERVESEGGGRLPTAATCFNKLRLPQYSTELELKGKLLIAITGAHGFDEHAVAE